MFHILDFCFFFRERQVLSAENFSKSLLYGCKYVYQSMSCLLNLWLDYGARFMKDAPKPRPCSIDNVITLEKFNKIMSKCHFIILPLSS